MRCLPVIAALVLAAPALASAQAAPPAQPANTVTATQDHAFDWIFGTWKATLRRLDRPLTGSTKWIEFEGMQYSKKVWGGRASLDEFVVNSPSTNTVIEGVTLRLYDPKAQQWRIYWANAKRGIVDPPVVGRFTDGRGEFYGQDELDGRVILVRYIWSDITSTSAHFEQSFSADGGKTWEPNWISDVTRVKD
ncbi:MAG: hypothetical protein ACAI18_05250 [Gemmatimonadales bacterium]